MANVIQALLQLAFSLLFITTVVLGLLIDSTLKFHTRWWEVLWDRLTFVTVALGLSSVLASLITWGAPGTPSDPKTRAPDLKD
jgi:hypothetical protein